VLDCDIYKKLKDHKRKRFENKSLKTV